jgi:[acyl-carrier-protein] S-malonyltransferase
MSEASMTGWLLFPGQGAQSVGMGQEMAEAFPSARALYEQASDILGLDLAALCFAGPKEELDKTENAQPALLVTSLACLAALRDHAGEVVIEGAMGLSLGEYTALVALGVLDFADAVRLVRRRGELMEQAAGDRDSSMSSVMGLKPEQIGRASCRERV